MRPPPDFRLRPLIVEHACACALCAAPLRMVERLTPARFTYFVDRDGAGIGRCPGCGQSLDRALRAGTVRRLSGGAHAGRSQPAAWPAAAQAGRPRP